MRDRFTLNFHVPPIYISYIFCKLLLFVHILNKPIKISNSSLTETNNGAIFWEPSAMIFIKLKMSFTFILAYIYIQDLTLGKNWAMSSQ